jgi:DNA-binding transcriptional LysR family regulator
MTDTLALYRTFVRVVEAGSFSAVARELGTTQPTVSRQVAELERRLGARLIGRTTRALSVTDDGRAFHERAREVLALAQEAEGAVGRRRAAPSGLLRMAVPVVFGRLHVLPRIPRFMERHPDVSLDLVMSDGFSDLVEQGIDLAVRVGEVVDPGLVARRIGITRRIAVASPGYLARRGAPAHPADLASHECIVYARLATGRRWRFGGPDGPVEVEVSGRFRVDNSEGVREAVLAGLGIGVLPVWHFGAELRDGRAVPVLQAFEPAALPTSAVFPSRRYLPAKVRAMADFLAHEFSLDPLLSDYGVPG